MNSATKLGLGVALASVLVVATSTLARHGTAPDGLQPPPGPVTDTQPSLTSINEQITSLQSGGVGFPPDLRYFQDGLGGNQQSETVVFVSQNEADFVRIHSVKVTSATTNLLVGPSEDVVAIIGGSAVLSSGQVIGSSDFDFGGLRVPTPVKFRTSGQDSGSLVTLLYWVE